MLQRSGISPILFAATISLPLAACAAEVSGPDGAGAAKGLDGTGFTELRYECREDERLGWTDCAHVASLTLPDSAAIDEPTTECDCSCWREGTPEGAVRLCARLQHDAVSTSCATAVGTSGSALWLLGERPQASRFFGAGGCEAALEACTEWRGTDDARSCAVLAMRSCRDRDGTYHAPGAARPGGDVCQADGTWASRYRSGER